MDYLKDIIRGIFEKVFAPIISKLLKEIVMDLIDMLKDAFAWVFYEAMSIFLRIADFLSTVFEFFAGTSRGHVLFKTEDMDEAVNTTVLELFLGLGDVQRIFLIITVFAVGLSVIFSIVAVMRSMSDMTLENKNPISKVLKSSFKSAVMFMLVPYLCIFLLQVSNVVMTGIDTAMLNSDQGNISISDTIWLAASMDAALNSAYNSANCKVGAKDPLRKNYVGNGENKYAKYNYDAKCIKDYFDLTKFDYGLGITTAVVLDAILAICLLTFVRRIFEILVLYLVAPLFVSTMPLDDGEMFKKWKDMFVAKFFSGFGSIVSMRLYLMIAPVIGSGQLVLYPGNTRIDSIVKLVLIIGGAIAVYGAQPMIMKMLNYEAGFAEAASMNVMGGLANQSLGMVKNAGQSFGRGFTGKSPEEEEKKKGGSNRNGGLDSSKERDAANMKINAKG